MVQLTFNTGLTVNGFRATRPRCLDDLCGLIRLRLIRLSACLPTDESLEDDIWPRTSFTWTSYPSQEAKLSSNINSTSDNSSPE